MRNENGQLTLEFMFALILVVSVSTLLGVITFTLSLTEILQYVTFSAARTYLAADLKQTDQAQAGNDKAQSLLTSLPFLRGAEQNGWIKVTPKGAQSYAGYRDSIGADPTHSQFEGYQLQLTVPMLNVQIPFIKDVVTPPEGSQDFSTTLSSFLTREPAFEECQRFFNGAYDSLIKAGSYSVQNGDEPTIIIDNGC